VPYVSKEERERTKWLDLGRLEAQACAAEGCSQDEARVQIVRALGDGAIWPLRWDPEPASPPHSGSGFRIPGYPPPRGGRGDWRVLDHWRVVKLDWERSRVFDDFERAAYPALRKLWRDDDPIIGADDAYSSSARPRGPPKPRRSVWRQLLLDRAACEAIWPPSAAEREASEALRAELRRLPEALTELRASVQTAVRTRQAPDVPADVVAEKMQAAGDGVAPELLGFLASGRFVAFLDTTYGLERLPSGEYWLRPDGSPQPEATRAFISGTASSIRHRNAAGIVMVRSDDFRVFGAQYLGAHGLAEQSFPSAAPRPRARRLPPPTEPLREARNLTIMDHRDCEDPDESRHATARSVRKRLTYVGALQAYVATRNPIALARMDDNAIALQFVSHIEAQAKKGDATPPLPGLRAIRKQVGPIRQRRSGAAPNAANGTAPNGS
jgi:hypothetical protein